MSESVLYSCLVLLAIGSIWAFGALMRTVGNRMKWNPRMAFWTSAILYGFLGLYHTVVASSVGVQ